MLAAQTAALQLVFSVYWEASVSCQGKVYFLKLVSTYFVASIRFVQSGSHTVEAERAAAIQPLRSAGWTSLKPPWSKSLRSGREFRPGCQCVRFHRRSFVCRNFLEKTAEEDLPAAYPAPPSSLRSNSSHVTGEGGLSGSTKLVSCG